MQELSHPGDLISSYPSFYSSANQSAWSLLQWRLQGQLPDMHAFSKSADACTGFCMQTVDSGNIQGSSSFIYIYYGSKPLDVNQKNWMMCRPLINYLTE